jgi:uncharacterized protein YdeI (YjbR/CyaY-like superfamily)
MPRSHAVDSYIEQAAPFARPILRKVREAFHEACPEIEERLKWSVPSFESKGLVGGMAAFKAHVSFGFWKAKLMDDPHGLLKPDGKGGMWGLRLESVEELPPRKVLVAYVKQAVALNEQGVKAPRGDPQRNAPAYFLAALRAEPAALATWESFPPSHKREYIEWVTEAKQEATRERRLAQAVVWIAEGKPRNWKYMKK